MLPKISIQSFGLSDPTQINIITFNSSDSKTSLPCLTWLTSINKISNVCHYSNTPLPLPFFPSFLHSFILSFYSFILAELVKTILFSLCFEWQCKAKALCRRCCLSNPLTQQKCAAYLLHSNRWDQRGERELNQSLNFVNLSLPQPRSSLSVP